MPRFSMKSVHNATLRSDLIDGCSRFTFYKYKKREKIFIYKFATER